MIITNNYQQFTKKYSQRRKFSSLGLKPADVPHPSSSPSTNNLYSNQKIIHKSPLRKYIGKGDFFIYEKGIDNYLCDFSLHLWSDDLWLSI